MPNIWPLVHFPSYHPHPSYSFLFYNCPPDKALEQSFDPYSSSKIFRLRAFRFFNDYDSFYLHCELLACDRYSENSRSVLIVVVVVVFILFTLILGLLLLLNFFLWFAKFVCWKVSTLMFTTRNMDVLANKKHWGHNWPPHL